MVEIGKLNTLEIVKEVEFGLYLDGDQFDNILLPRRYVPKGVKVGDEIEVFIYTDSEDRLIATTEKPLAMVNEFTNLRVVSSSEIGAFLDWGLPKDLFLPKREQNRILNEGNHCLVRVYLDEKTDRIVASARLDNYLDKYMVDFDEGEEVELIIAKKTDLGFKAIVDEVSWGLLYENEVFMELKPGQRVTGYIKAIRGDGKIDLTLYQPGYERIDDVASEIFRKLQLNDGYLKVNDKSSPELISKIFGESKKAFKKAVGSLYKQRLIEFKDDGIAIIEKTNKLGITKAEIKEVEAKAEIKEVEIKEVEAKVEIKEVEAKVADEENN
jgi:uncharacterized protein